MNGTMRHKTDDGGGDESRHAFVCFLFFLSGAASLVCELSWSRMIGTAAGQTARAAALVLAAYFTGLAVGHFLGGRLTRRAPPLLGYGLAELLAAAWSCGVPSLLGWVGMSAGPGGFEWGRDSAAGRAAWSFLILLPATVPMGATLPFVLASLPPRQRPVAYGLNTTGGLVGITAATGFLLVVAGVGASALLAAGLMASCGAAACVTSLVRRKSIMSLPPAMTDDHGGGSRAWTATAAVSGFGILGLEVLYTRLFSLVLHNSAYTFGMVIASFLLSLCLGAALASRLGRRFSPRQVATAAFPLGGLALAVSVVAFPRLTGLNYFSAGEAFGGYLAGVAGLVAVFVLPPVTLLGMALPAAFQAAKGGRAVGWLAAANTAAGAAGALAAGFLLPPLFGLWSAFGVFVAMFGAAGSVMLARCGHPKLAVPGLILGAAAAVMTGQGPPAGLTDGQQVLRRWESEYGWVDVVRTDKGALEVRQNLHYRHGSTATATREYRQGRLPLLLHPKPAEVAFLGLGTGLTAAPAVADRDVSRAVIIELIPEVTEAARVLSPANLGVVDHPKTEIRIDDARHHLQRTSRRFDVVVSDLFVPWESRAGYLYTVEFYTTVRRALRPGGLFCQWLALYQFGPEQFELVADSFSSVFPHTTIWWGNYDADYPIIALVGADQPITVDPLSLEERFDSSDGLPGGADPDLGRSADVPSLWVGGWPRRPARRLNTDEHPWLEFTSPVSQRSGQTLHGPVLRRYYDDVLARLPDGGVLFSGELDALSRTTDRRRAVQRLSLFGDLKP